MKRPMPWSDEEDGDSADDDESSSSSHSDSEASKKKSSDFSKAAKSSKDKKSQGNRGRRKSGIVDFEALKRHGYKGGLSVLSVPVPKEEVKQDWSWSTGKECRGTEVEESYIERQKTRAALMDGEELNNVQTQREKKNLSFSQKEKRKRELGQASRGKNYVEEEKRLLRDSGVYSGFDT